MNCTQTGLSIRISCCVSFSNPFSVSRSYTWMTLLSLQAASRYLPLGVILKWRGWMPVDWYPARVNVPFTVSTVKMAIPSPSRRLLA